MIRIITLLPSLMATVLCQASAIFYDDKDLFYSNNSNYILEDFEDINIPSGTNTTVPETLDSNTITSLIEPGDIIPGISFTNPDGEIRLLGHNDVSYFTTLTPADSVRLSFENDDGQELVIGFSEGLSAFGLDVIGIDDPAIDVTLLFSNGLSHTQSINAAIDMNTFFGWESRDSLINGIIFDSISDGYFAIDDVALAKESVTKIPEPSNLSLILLGLLYFAWQTNISGRYICPSPLKILRSCASRA